MKLYAAQKDAVRKNIASHGIFDKTCTFKSETVTQSDSGAEVRSWTNVTGLTSIPCMIVSKATTINDLNGAPVTQLITKIKLNGFYPLASAEHQLVADSKTYKITAIDSGSLELFTEIYVIQWGA
jgi:hypothetical protein